MFTDYFRRTVVVGASAVIFVCVVYVVESLRPISYVQPSPSSTIPGIESTAGAVQLRFDIIQPLTYLDHVRIYTNGTLLGTYWKFLVTQSGSEGFVPAYIPEAMIAVPAGWIPTKGCHFMRSSYGKYVQIDEKPAPFDAAKSTLP